MKYAIFPTTDAEKINTFMQENSKGLALDGVKFHEGYVSFFYLDDAEIAEQAPKTKEAKIKERLLASIQDALEAQHIAVLNAEMDIRSARMNSLHGDKNAGQLVIDRVDMKKRTQEKLAIIESMMRAVEIDEWDPKKKE